MSEDIIHQSRVVIGSEKVYLVTFLKDGTANIECQLMKLGNIPAERSFLNSDFLPVQLHQLNYRDSLSAEVNIIDILYSDHNYRYFDSDNQLGEGKLTELANLELAHFTSIAAIYAALDEASRKAVSHPELSTKVKAAKASIGYVPVSAPSIG